MTIKRQILFLLVCLLGSLPSASPVAADGASEKSPVYIGKVHFEQTAASVTKAIGAPESRGDKSVEGATGLTLQEWRYPKLGLLLEMAQSANSAPSVYRLTAQAPCTLEWFGGARIGMSQGKLFTLLGLAENKYGAESQVSSPDSFGIFWPKEYAVMSFELIDRKVTKIYIVPGPE